MTARATTRHASRVAPKPRVLGRPNVTITCLILLLALTLARRGSAGINTWTSLGLAAGEARSLAIDPWDPTTLYLGNRQGLYKSTDAGISWNRASFPREEITIIEIAPSRPSRVYAANRCAFYTSTNGGTSWSENPSPCLVNQLAIDPLDPLTVYAVTGREDCQGRTDCLPGLLFKSTNEGASWRAVDEGLTGTTCYALAIDPSNSSIVYAVMPQGIFKSIDGALHWELAAGFDGDFRASNLVIDPWDPATLYASGYTGTVFKSVDAGRSWTPSGPPLGRGIHSLSIDPSNPATIYAVTAGGSLGIAVFKSLDSGFSWEQILSDFGHRYASLVLDPTNPQILYAGTWGERLRKSLDGGQTWQPLTDTPTVELFVESLVFDPLESSTLYAATEYGVFKSVDVGRSWSAARKGLGTIGVKGLAIDSENPSTLYGGTGYGLFKSVDAGQSWFRTTTGFAVDALLLAPRDPSVLYIGTNTGTYKSVNAGATWRKLDIGPGDPRVSALAMDPDHTEVYAGTVDGVFKSLDRGRSWIPINNGLSNLSILSLAIHPRNPSVLYAGTLEKVFKSTDAGATWIPSGQGLLYDAVTDLIIDPRTPSTLYAIASSILFQSVDAGRSWSYFGSPPGYETALTLHPWSHATIFTGTSQGLYELTRIDCRDSSTLCLNDERFVVEVVWRDSAGILGTGRMVPARSNDSGLLWFFDAENWEMLVKVLDGCGINGSFWVFAAATTDVEYVLRVTDRQTGLARSYHNPLGTSAAAVTDTAAFAGCPGQEDSE